MIRNYNGNLNRNVIRDLKKICKINAENEQNLFSVFDEKGVVYVYENLDPFLGCPDELSTTVELKTEDQIKEYLKKDFLKRISSYLNRFKPAQDYLLDDLLSYIKDNCRFPEKHILTEIEKEAEKKRIASLLYKVRRPKKSTELDIAEEILELSEEIMEARRENHPEDIVVPVEPYPEDLPIRNKVITGDILHEHYYNNRDCTDYRCMFRIYSDWNIVFSFEYGCDRLPNFKAQCSYNENQKIENVIGKIITIHKQIVEIAKKEGIEFISEIDYDKALNA